MSKVKLLKLVPLLTRAVAPYWRDIEHSMSKLDKGASLDRNIELGKIREDPVDEPLQLLLA